MIDTVKNIAHWFSHLNFCNGPMSWVPYFLHLNDKRMETWLRKFSLGKNSLEVVETGILVNSIWVSLHSTRRDKQMVVLWPNTMSELYTCCCDRKDKWSDLYTIMEESRERWKTMETELCAFIWLSDGEDAVSLLSCFLFWLFTLVSSKDYRNFGVLYFLYWPLWCLPLKKQSL